LADLRTEWAAPLPRDFQLLTANPHQVVVLVDAPPVPGPPIVFWCWPAGHWQTLAEIAAKFRRK